MRDASHWYCAVVGMLLWAPMSHADDPPKPAKASDQVKADKDYELLKLFADALDQVERNYVKEVDRRELMEGAIKGMLSELDPHSSYIGPSDLEKFKGSIENEFGGIGITVSTETGELVVTTPLYGTPAYRAGIRGGDKITEIDGQPTKGITMDEAIKRIKGKLGTAVKLSVLHLADGSTDSKDVTRELIRVDSVIGDHRKADDTWNFFLDEEKKIGYIRITTFARHTADEVRSAMQQLSANGVKGLILDLRWNSGGLLTSAIEISDFFVAEGRIVSTASRSAPARIWDAKKDGTFEGFPIAVLVNHSSASASEILAACLQDHKKAVVIGERTWGKGSVQNIIELDDGKSALKLTTAGYKRPSGQNIHREEGAKETDEWGVKPSPGFELKLTDEEVEAYFADRKARDVITAKAKEPAPTADRKLDKQVQKAVDYLGTELAKNEETPK